MQWPREREREEKAQQLYMQLIGDAKWYLFVLVSNVCVHELVCCVPREYAIRDDVINTELNEWQNECCCKSTCMHIMEEKRKGER